ncbi:unnamed protein product [Rotaria sp. Silwood2]|nr:unnamed protein product [Rotaria sp. Silwood2]CAF2909506.1 unnamed protein product [Rotaria sp. Silwood2]CAF3324447.1 unnamed protein product [Rotaria sp. Silwood2]CAF4038930.1 unnamed protein product [Rotaria sp. Silwood2]CAF4163729.1 unnamed protein product [Rotaria sp. Silwood2]
MLFSISILITILWIVSSTPQYNLYYTNRISTSGANLHYDCLYYHVRNDIVKYKTPSRYAYQIIPYCIRPSELELFRVKHDTLVEGRSITFDELNANNITGKQLIRWSASIDIAEQYQARVNFGSGVFYNCTRPIFGDYCQYSLYPPNQSFSDVVHHIFLSKNDLSFEPVDYISYSCYTHVECDRGPVPMCLDWREICDNHIDCLNGGQDEENCFLLELNECADDEFRCRNGMCIPNYFFHDDELNPDCLDGTDEYQILLESEECFRDPAFRCSERSPPYELGFSCGDDTFTTIHASPSIHELYENLISSSDHPIISKLSQTWNDESIGSDMMREPDDLYHHRAWFCNRGIPIYNHRRRSTSRQRQQQRRTSGARQLQLNDFMSPQVHDILSINIPNLSLDFNLKTSDTTTIETRSNLLVNALPQRSKFATQVITRNGTTQPFNVYDDLNKNFNEQQPK